MEDTFHLGIKGLIRNQAGDILLLQVNSAILDGNDYWDLPGGRVQQGDSVEDTLRREIEEETGISEISRIKPVSMVLSKIRIPQGTTTVGLILSVYECTITPDTQISLSEEHQSYAWYPPAKAAALLNVKYPPQFCDSISAL